MARKQSSTLTDAELRSMEILWQRGSATVAEVLAALPKDPELSPGGGERSKVRDKVRAFTSATESLPVRHAALDQLAAAGDAGATEQYIAIYHSDVEQPTKERCSRALGRIRSKPSRDFLIAIAKDDLEPDLRRIALHALVAPLAEDKLATARPAEIGSRDLQAMLGPGSNLHRPDYSDSEMNFVPPSPPDWRRQGPNKEYGQRPPPPPPPGPGD